MNLSFFYPYLSLLRPRQWIKNLFVLMPVLFSKQYLFPEVFVTALFAVVLFCLASSASYVLNDILDVSKDRLHPENRKRPLASGKIPLQHGFLVWVVLVLMTLLFSIIISPAFFVVMLGYLMMTTAYSLFLKNILFLDVILIALGFVFRVLGGGVAVQVVVSDWMIVLTFLFTLFLAFSKRRQEVKACEGKSARTRHVLSQYTVPLIDQLNAMIVPIIVTSYIVYTFSVRPNNLYFIATIPLVIYAFFRYLYLLKHTVYAARSDDYLTDWQWVGVGGAWFILVMMGL